MKNIQDNPNVALLIDKHSEDWTKLAFVTYMASNNHNNQNTRKYSTAGSLQETVYTISPISKN